MHSQWFPGHTQYTQTALTPPELGGSILCGASVNTGSGDLDFQAIGTEQSFFIFHILF